MGNFYAIPCFLTLLVYVIGIFYDNVGSMS